MKRIAIYNAKPEMVLAKDIQSRSGRLLLSKGSVITKDWIDRLLKYGIPVIYVEEDTKASELENAEIVGAKYGSKVMYTENIPDVISLEVREEAERVVQQVMQDVKTGNLFKTDKARKVVEKIVNQLVNNKNIAGKLADIRILDDYTFAHSVNVCILSISNGIIMGYSKIKLLELGIGALLHDIGKMRVPDEILNKPGPLTKSEFEVIKKHSAFGYEILSEHREVTANAARISLQHHECFNGSGYPRGINDTEIHEYSKIVAVADVYDALTADRVYKNAILPYEAMEIIIASSGFQFNPGIVKLFVENSEIYPVGSRVMLNTGESGMVIDVARVLPTRPKVKLLTDSNGNEIGTGVEIDLMNSPTIFVDRLLNFRKRICL